MNTRLFPKGQGANRYHITGLAALCDTVVLSDSTPPFSALLKTQNLNNSIRTVFVSMRNFEAALETLEREVLQTISSSFIVIFASEDATFPTQLDKRFKPFSPQADDIIKKLFENRFLIHCYVENLSHPFSNKVSPIPLGIVDPKNEDIFSDEVDVSVPLEKRARRVFCCHRVREGLQWMPRIIVNELAKTHWKSLCEVVTEELSIEEYYEKLSNFAFTVCVQGGGQDPSPKAFQTILKGGIPIIKSSALDPAYALLNCVIVEDWSKYTITESKLEKWYNDELTRRKSPEYLRKIHYMLTLDFWWGEVKQAHPINYLTSKPNCLSE